MSTMNYANQSKVLTSYGTGKKIMKANRKEEFVFEIYSIQHENDFQHCQIVVCVCVSHSVCLWCDISTLFIANSASFDDYGHTSFVAQQNPNP